ncbi:MAG: hydrogenase maturation nickel metallochaperone HypA [Oscillospiraceae bacterium]|nr:hydrogenase maturation nickel metallochaperone HypA [Oscillospiraceae bacterium]
MHELGVMMKVLDVALKVAEENHAKAVTEIDIDLGVMTGVIPRHAQTMFDLIAKDTIAAGAVVNFHPVPARFFCRDCGARMTKYKADVEFFCDSCGSGNLFLEDGAGFHMTNLGMVTGA